MAIVKELVGNNIRFLANLGQAQCGACLAGLGASPGWISKSPKPGASALRLDSDAEAVGYRIALNLAGVGGWFGQGDLRVDQLRNRIRLMLIQYLIGIRMLGHSIRLYVLDLQYLHLVQQSPCLGVLLSKEHDKRSADISDVPILISYSNSAFALLN